MSVVVNTLLFHSLNSQYENYLNSTSALKREGFKKICGQLQIGFNIKFCSHPPSPTRYKTLSICSHHHNVTNAFKVVSWCLEAAQKHSKSFLQAVGCAGSPGRTHTAGKSSFVLVECTLGFQGMGLLHVKRMEGWGAMQGRLGTLSARLS